MAIRIPGQRFHNFHADHTQLFLGRRFVCFIVERPPPATPCVVSNRSGERHNRASIV
jgi:hypothetical protein